MKRTAHIVISAILLIGSAFAQVGPSGASKTQAFVQHDQATFTASGQSVYFVDSGGALLNQFGIHFNTTLSTALVSFFGCLNTPIPNLYNCATAPIVTYTGLIDAPLTVSGPYDAYYVTATWTGGTAASTIAVNRLGVPAGQGSGTSTVTVSNFPVDGSNFVNTDMQAVGGTPVSLYATLINNQTFTAQITGSAVRAPAQSLVGTLYIQSSPALSGSPSGCQVALSVQMNGGYTTGTAFFTQAFTPSTSVQSFSVATPGTVAAGSSIVAVASCSGAYPATGALTVDFDAYTPVYNLAQYNTTAPAPTNAQSVAAQSDGAGNLKTTTGGYTFTGTVWTTATALNSTQVIYSNSGAGAVQVELDQTTTLTVGAITFQCSYDNINWVTCPIAVNMLSTAQIANPYTLVASTNQPVLIPTLGASQVRLLLSTAITGSATVTPIITWLPGNPATFAYLFGHTGNSFDSTVNTTLPASTLNVGGLIQTSQTNPAVGTTGRQGRFASDLSGNTYVLDHSPNVVSGFITISTATTTQVLAIAAAGFSHYITNIVLWTTTAGTGSTLQLVTGTGSNCVTGQANLSPAFPNTATGLIEIPLKTPIFAGAGNEICVTQTATAGTTIVWLTGYDAP